MVCGRVEKALEGEARNRCLWCQSLQIWQTVHIDQIERVGEGALLVRWTLSPQFDLSQEMFAKVRARNARKFCSDRNLRTATPNRHPRLVLGGEAHGPRIDTVGMTHCGLGFTEEGGTLAGLVYAVTIRCEFVESKLLDCHSD